MHNLRGILLMTLAMGAFAISDAFIKGLSGTLPVGQIMGWLGLLGGAAFWLAVRLQGQRIDPRLIANPIVAGRAAAEVVGSLAFVTSLSLIPLATASAIAQSAPLIVTMGAALFLRERVGWRRWTAILVGFCGVMIILRPGMDGFQVGALFAVLGAFGLAVRDLSGRLVPASVSNLQLGFWGFVALAPCAFAFDWALGRAPGPLNAATLPPLLAAIAFAALAIWAVTAAMRAGDVAVIAPFRYTRLIFAIAIGLVFFAEAPDRFTWVGAAVVLGAGLYTLWREARLRGA